jgi:2,3-bisphosphoglycerate-dependent phosphoglycerate mutase
VFSSDLRRARGTAEVAFAHCPIPILLDWRLRECDYGERNGSAAEVHVGDRRRYVDHPYPGGESWRQATARVATRWALDHYLNRVALEWLATED